ncbi:MAG: SGNH/GDSL hydrolase family protein [Rhizobiaceae bacterium]|nr:SGNH/GDSL hydrolase family protein [Rhizobiaceae bacterium]
MKTVLCYGDSLTWGYSAEIVGRHAFADRWPNVLATALGGDVTVIAEGLNGRTTAFDDPTDGADRNGARTLPMVLSTHAPVDLIIVMLGANDMKGWVHGQAIAAREGMERIIDVVRGHAYPLNGKAPDILIVSPPPLCETAEPRFAAMFEGGIAQSQMLASLYADLADETDCGFFDAGSVAKTTPLDGVHLDAASTRAVGRGLEPVVRMMLGL